MNNKNGGTAKLNRIGGTDIFGMQFYWMIN